MSNYMDSSSARNGDLGFLTNVNMESSQNLKVHDLEDEESFDISNKR